MQFDLNALLQDPQFQTGMGLMGLASPKNRAMFQAYQMLQAQRQTQMEAEKQKQEMEYRQSQIGQSDARTKAYLRDIAVKEAEQKATERRWNLLLQSNPELRELMQQQEAGAQTPAIPTPTATTPQPSASPLASAMQADPARPIITPEMQRGADLEAITMIQSELDKENNPLNKAALSREIERLQKGIGTAVPQAVPSGNKILQSEIDKYRKKKMLAGLMQSDPAKAAEIMAEATAPKSYPAGAMVATQEGFTQVPDPSGDESRRLAREAAARAAARETRDAAKDAREVAAGPKLTEAEAKATTYLKQMKDANAVMDGMLAKGWDPETLGNQAKVALAGGVTNVAASEEAQQVKQAQEQWSEAYLRFKTGAATNADEIARNIRTFFPQFGDKPANIKQKKAARLDAQKAMEVAAGQGMSKLGTQTPSKTVVRSGVRKSDGARVIEYSDGTREYVKQ